MTRTQKIGLATLVAAGALLLTTLFATADPQAGPPAPAKPAAPAASDEYSYSSSAEGSFMLGDKKCPLFASLRNDPTKPQLWSFVYPPLLLPQADKNGQPEFIITPVDPAKPGGRYQVSLTVWLSTPESDEKALQALRRVYPAEKDKLQLGNVGILPIKALDVEVPNLTGFNLGATIGIGHFDFAFEPSRTVEMTMEAPDKASADMLATRLGKDILQVKLGYSSRSVKVNQGTVSMKRMASTKFYQELFGEGNIAFVHRDALNDLIAKHAQEIDVDIMVEDPAAFSQAFAIELLDKSAGRALRCKDESVRWRKEFRLG